MKYLKSKDRISFTIKGKAYNVQKGNPAYPAIEKALKDGLSDTEVLKLLNAPMTVAAKGVSYSKDNTILLNGKPMSKALIARYRYMLEHDIPTKGFKLFIANLVKNPLKSAIDELFGFLEACDLPITEDGCFLAYKRVGSQFKDLHSGTFDNHPGKIVSMPRKSVDPDRNSTCSTGLHVCSKSYLSGYGGEHTIVVKVNPKDVVAVPTDYDQSKMRVCRYEVLEELDFNKTKAEGAEVIPKMAVKNSKPKADKSASKSSVSLSKSIKDYATERSLPSKLADMTVDQRKNFKKMLCRLAGEKSMPGWLSDVTTVTQAISAVKANVR